LIPPQPQSSKTTFQPKLLLLAFSTAFIITATLIPFQVSIAALIFTGDLEQFLPFGMGILLMGVVIYGLVTILYSAFPLSISIPQERTAVLVAILTSGIANELNGKSSEEELFATVLVAIIITTVLTGILFLGLGYFRLGNLVRFIPYPVMGGFIAGTGWLLTTGGFQVMIGEEFSIYNLADYFQPQALVIWLPGLVFGFVLLFFQRRFKQVLILPALIIVFILIFYLALNLMGISLEEGRAAGLLFEEMPAGYLWQPISLLLINQVHWDAILHQAGQIISVLIIATISFLLNLSALELGANREIDLNRELRANSISNLAASFIGSPPGYTSLSFSSLGLRMKSFTRWNAVFLAFLFILILVFGGPILSTLPKMIIGGMLIFLGLGFLAEWLVDSLKKLLPIDYAVVWAILLTAIFLGSLASIGLGLLLSGMMFLFEYSRINNILVIAKGQTRHSHVERTQQQIHCLEEHGARILIVELQGFIFFGTSSQLYSRLKEEINQQIDPAVGYIVIDFRRVSGLDASAVLSFTRLEQLAEDKSFQLVLTDLSQSIYQKFTKGLLTIENGSLWRSDQDLDHGLEWCENQILASCHHEPLYTLQDTQKRLVGFEQLLKTGLSDYFSRLEVPENHLLIKQGEAPVGLFFVHTGQVTAQLEQETGHAIRLRTMEAGTIVGELGVYLNKPASASVITTQPSVIYLLAIGDFHHIDKANPEIAAALHKFLAQRISERLLTSLTTIQDLSNFGTISSH
jgi:SulP family sulfate permease